MQLFVTGNVRGPVHGAGRGSVPGSRSLRHLPLAEAAHLMGQWGPPVPRDAPGVALNRLFDRLPDLRLDPHDDPHIRGHVFRSPTSLPVLFGTRS